MVMRNMSMMAHPMHIHGHTWSLPGNGGLRKDTVLVLPMQTVTADLQRAYPGAEVEVVPGGQPHYPLLIGVE